MPRSNQKNINKLDIKNSDEWFLIDLKRGIYTSLDKNSNPVFTKYKASLFTLTRSKEVVQKLCVNKYFFQSISPSNTWITDDSNFITNCIASYYLIAANAHKLHNYDLKKHIDSLFTINEKEIIGKYVYGYFDLIKDNKSNKSSKTNNAQKVQNKINYYKTKDIFKLLKQKKCVNRFTIN